MKIIVIFFIFVAELISDNSFGAAYIDFPRGNVDYQGSCAIGYLAQGTECVSCIQPSQTYVNNMNTCEQLIWYNTPNSNGISTLVVYTERLLTDLYEVNNIDYESIDLQVTTITLDDYGNVLTDITTDQIFYESYNELTNQALYLGTMPPTEPPTPTPNPTPNPTQSPTPVPSPTIVPSATPIPSQTPDLENPPSAIDQASDTIIASDSGQIIMDSDGTELTDDGNPVNASSNPACDSCGQPVNLANGTMWHQFLDFSLRGNTPKTGIEFHRFYLSHTLTPSDDFGPHWFHSYQTRILSVEQKTNPDLIWLDQNGGAWTFVRNLNGTLKSPTGFYGTLTEYSDHYELVQKGKITLFFSKNATVAPIGRLLEIKDAHGAHVDLTYTSGKLSSLSTALAGAITFTRNAKGLISKITRVRDDLSYEFTYDVNSNLITSSDIDGNLTKYAYTTADNASKSLLSVITDPLKRTIQYFYNSDGTASSQIEHGNAQRSFLYGMLNGNRTTQVTEIDQTVSMYHFDTQFRTIEVDEPNGGVSKQTWNSENLPAKKTDELGYVTSYGYDAHGNVSSILKPLDPKPTEITYDQTFDVPVVIQPILDSPLLFTVNAATGDVSNFIRTIGSTNLELKFSYDSLGNVTATDNSLTQYSNQYSVNGLETKIFDLHNPETRTYDSRARVTTRAFKSGRILSYTYDDFDRILSVSDNSGPDTIFTYDVLGRVLSQTRTDGTTNEKNQYTWDARDRLIKKTDTQGNITTFNYDNGNQVIDKTTSITDANGHTTHFQYDSMQQLFQSVDAKGGATFYTYDLKGELMALVDPKGNTTSFTYDKNGRLSNRIEASVANKNGKNVVVNQKTSFTYDAQGRVVEQAKISASDSSLAAVTHYAYDQLGRVSSKTQYRRNGTEVISVEDSSNYVYEPTLDVTKLIQANNSAAQLSFQYETAPPFKNIQFSDQNSQFQGAFDVIRGITGDIVKITNQNGSVVENATYDIAGRLLSISSGSFIPGSANAWNAIITNDSFGRKSKTSFSNGANEQYQYDHLNRVTNSTWYDPHSKVTQEIERLVYDPAGNVSKRTRPITVESFSYDPSNELVNAATVLSAGSAIFSTAIATVYDANGNRTNQSIGGVSTSEVNFLVSGNGLQYFSDADGYGERASAVDFFGNKDSYTYRTDGKLVSYVRTDKNGQMLISTQYFYDALNRRMMKKITNALGNNFSNTFVHLSDEDRILLSKNGVSQMTVYLDGQGVDEHLGHTSSQGPIFYSTDHLGSVNNSPAAGIFGGYGAFGESPTLVHFTNQNQDPSMYGFAGRNYDTETGFYYNRARMYDPSSGTFTTKDSIGFAGGDANLYRYTGNNPLLHTDPSGNVCGLDDVTEIVLATGIAGAVAAGGTTLAEGGTTSQVISASLAGFVAGASAGVTSIAGLAFGVSSAISTIIAAGVDTIVSIGLAPTSLPSSTSGSDIVNGLNSINGNSQPVAGGSTP
jgi:RHS repeat-associated protein